MLATVIRTGVDLLIGGVPSVRAASPDGAELDGTGLDSADAAIADDAAIAGADDIGAADPLSTTAEDAGVEGAAAAFGELLEAHPTAQTARATNPNATAVCARDLQLGAAWRITSGVDADARPRLLRSHPQRR